MKWFLTLFLLMAMNAFAAREAVVTAKRAVVYSDLKLTSPIGYLRQGKKIAVGDVKRNRGEVVPIVVNHKIAYLRVKDLAIEGDVLQEYQGARVTEHEFDYDEEKRQFDSLKENNYLHFHFGSITPKESTLTVMEAVGETPTASSEMGLMIEHRHPLKNYAWGIGAKLFSTKSESVEYHSFTIDARYQWILLRFAGLAVGPYAGVLGTGDYRISVADVGDYRGAMYGGFAGGEARLFSDSKISISLGAEFLTQKLIGFEKIQNNLNDDEVSAQSLSAFQAYAALVWRL